MLFEVIPASAGGCGKGVWFSAVPLLHERETAYDRLAEEFQPAVDRIEQGDPGVEVDIEAIKAFGRKYLA